MILRRKEAIILSSFYKFLNLTLEEREFQIEDSLAEISLEIGDVAPEVSNYYARKSIEYKFSRFNNSYLQTFLSRQLGQTVEVKGKSKKLLPCLCCGYKTLDGIGWEICHVCYWEDDGISKLDEISSANHTSLFEAKENFKKFGVTSEEFQKYVDPDRMNQYDKTT